MHRLIMDLRSFEKTNTAYAFGQYLHVTGKEDGVEANEFEEFLLKKKHSNMEVLEIQPTIEDVFMDMMGEK